MERRSRPHMARTASAAMGAAPGVAQTRRTRKLASLAARNIVLRLIAQLAALLLMLWTGDQLGFWSAGDYRIYSAFYELRGTRASRQDVVLVGVDEDTVSRWGPPPYDWERLGPLYTAIASSTPAVTVFVEPGQRLARGGTQPSDVAQGFAARHLLAPAPAGTSAPPKLDGIDGVPVRGALLAEVLERSGLRAPDAERLPVNYLGADSLPQVSAARVAIGDIPAATFAGKIVLIGITAKSLTTEISTPIGQLAPAQLHAHALLGLTDGVAWRVPSTIPRWIVLAAIGLVVFVLGVRVDETRALLGLAGAGLTLVGVSYILFTRGALLWGPTAPIATLFVAAFVAGLAERRSLRRDLADLGRDLRLRVDADSLAGEAGKDGKDDGGFWIRVAELARLYLDCKSSIVAELPADRWHLALRVLVGTSLDQIQDRRRDVRRGAYHRAHVTLNPVWQDDFMSERLGQKTLLVPLVVSTRLLGFWILNFPVDAYLEPAHVKLITLLARQVALAVDHRQAGRIIGEQPALFRLLGPGLLERKLDAIGADTRRLSGDKRELAALVDSLPYGVLVGTLWGEVRYANGTMRRLIAEEGESRVASISIPEVLLLMTHLGKDEVFDNLRRMVRELTDLQLTGRTDGSGRRAKYQLSLSWLTRNQRADGDDDEQLLLLCALPTRLATRGSARASDFHDDRTTQSRMVGGGGRISLPTPVPFSAVSSTPTPVSFADPHHPSSADEPASGATERIPLEFAENLFFDAVEHGPGDDAEALQPVVDALHGHSQEERAHVKLEAPEPRGRPRSK